MWEILPEVQEQVGRIDTSSIGELHHTNHCLAPATQKLEKDQFVSKTTHKRMEILDNNAESIKSINDLKSLLQNHDNYPISICSHLKVEGSSDPSQTCGGMACDLTNNEFTFWRGCPQYDENFKKYSYKLSEGTFKVVN